MAFEAYDVLDGCCIYWYQSAVASHSAREILWHESFSLGGRETANGASGSPCKTEVHRVFYDVVIALASMSTARVYSLTSGACISARTLEDHDGTRERAISGPTCKIGAHSGDVVTTKLR
jgi:hypothetical protein